MKYFSVTQKEIDNNESGMQSSSIIDCMCCGYVITGMGGGGYYLCQNCVDNMLNGNISSAMYLFDRAKNGKNKT
jgi:CTP-dependent riboflavin kinase